MGDGLKKLLKLKDWLTVPETARHLSILFGEDVTEAHVLRFALDGYLALSVRFVNIIPVRYGMIFTPHAERMEIPSPEGNKVIEPPHIGGLSGVVSWEKDVKYIDGIWDLLMVSVGSTIVEQNY